MCDKSCCRNDLTSVKLFLVKIVPQEFLRGSQILGMLVGNVHFSVRLKVRLERLNPNIKNGVFRGGGQNGKIWGSIDHGSALISANNAKMILFLRPWAPCSVLFSSVCVCVVGCWPQLNGLNGHPFQDCVSLSPSDSCGLYNMNIPEWIQFGNMLVVINRREIG